MREKLIGFVTTKVLGEDSVNIIDYIHMFARKYNYGVLTIVPGVEYEDDIPVEQFNTLYMVNYEKLDAIIIDADSFIDTKFIDKLIDQSKEYNLPVVIINGRFDGVTCVTYDDDAAIKEIIEHVITEHNATKIALALRDRRPESKRFVEIYKETLRDAKIPFDDDYIVYAPYVESFFMDVIPDAVICQDDELAYSVINRLEFLGLNVPDNVIVVGASGSASSFVRIPALTTCAKDRKLVCEEAIKCIKRAFEGERNQDIYKIPSVAIFAKSCGCQGKAHAGIEIKCAKYAQQLDENIAHNRMLCTLSEKIMDKATIEELSSVLQSNLIDNTFICVRDSFMQDIFMDNLISASVKPSDKFYVIADNRKNHKLWSSYRLSDICPAFDELIDSDYPMILMPISYMGIQYGYAIFSDPDFTKRLGLFSRYVWTLNTSLGRYAMDKRLRFANSQLVKSDEDVRLLKDRDVLTGMYNTSGFLKAANKLKDRCVKTKETLVFACFDIAGLGDINEVYGHSEGDVAIQTFAKLLQENVSKDDICGHVGSDEFIVATVVRGEPYDIMESFFTALEGLVSNYNAVSSKDYRFEFNKTYLTVDPKEDTDLSAFMDETFSRKQVIKQGLKKTEENSNTGSANISKEDRKLVNSIIDNNKFTYAFQPIVNARNGDIYAYEALMRTTTTENVSPLKILEVATLDNRLYEIEYNTMFNVLKLVTENIDKLGDRKVFINSIPGHNLNKNDFSKFKRMYNEHFGNVVVEITEQTELDDKSLNMFKSLHADNGIEIAIDDFGSGYSNTSNLLRYIPNYVKIDRLLISNVNDDPKKQHFVKNIIEFAHDNGFMALAEGVENEEELKAVIQMGADLIQGYYTAKPNLDIIEKIPKEIGDAIIACNISNRNIPKKKVFMDEGAGEILLMRLALEQYSDVVITSKETTIIGNTEYGADIHIKIKDGCESIVHLKEVGIRGIGKLPCIDVGNNSKLTLILEGNNEFKGNGIRVSETGRLLIKGDGNLKITADDADNYGIGNMWEERFGNVTFNGDGQIEIAQVGDKCIGIGGVGGNITIKGGKYSFKLTGFKCLGIGTTDGEAHIDIRECAIDTRINSMDAVGIGSVNGKQKIHIANAKVEIYGESKKNFCGIGSFEGVYGKATIEYAHVIVDGIGNDVYLIGNCASGFELEMNKARFGLTGKGVNVVGLGSYDMNAKIKLVDGLLEAKLEAGSAKIYGAAQEDIITEALIEQVDVVNT